MISKILKKIFFYLKIFLSKFYSVRKKYRVGTKGWLIYSEIKYGGFRTKLKRNHVSEYDHRSNEEINTGGMTGGDRMFIHGYAKHYSNYLSKFAENRFEKINILEVGILQGTGLAIWSELFPNAKLFGADIDLSYFNENINFLKAKGGFKNNEPTLISFDQLNTEGYNNHQIRGIKFDVIIDDGLHSKEAILNTIKYFYPKLNKQFVYFIEDVKFNLSHEIKGIISDEKVVQHGELIVITNV